jgi:Catalase
MRCGERSCQQPSSLGILRWRQLTRGAPQLWRWCMVHGQSDAAAASRVVLRRAGPILLEDMHMINKNAQFNREKVPERVVHARGMTAKGYFEVNDGRFRLWMYDTVMCGRQIACL